MLSGLTGRKRLVKDFDLFDKEFYLKITVGNHGVVRLKLFTSQIKLGFKGIHFDCVRFK